MEDSSVIPEDKIDVNGYNGLHKPSVCCVGL